MIELEILVEVLDDYCRAESVLNNYNNTHTEHIVDTYFYDPLRGNLKPNESGKTFECLRIREYNSKAKLTYKKDVYKDEIWQYSDENEIDVENPNNLKEILYSLGLKELLTIDNKRKYYIYGNYEIVLENVKNLGVFLEIEYKGKITNTEIAVRRKEIQKFIDNIDLKVSLELNAGKPELYIKKHKIKL